MTLRNLTHSFIFLVVIVLFLSAWHTRVTGHLSLTAFGFLVIHAVLCLVYGNAFLALASPELKARIGLVFQFLCGYFVFNTLLFILTLASSLGMTANIFILSLGAAICLVCCPRRYECSDERQDGLPSLLCVIISGVAATLWCLDAQASPLIDGQTAIFRTWADTFIHVREISAFSQSHGLGTIFDIKMSGVPAPIYHFASYISAAAVSGLTGANAIDVYSSFMLPFGIFLTGLAAYSLIASFWGGWPALTASLTIVLVPDAYQQGFANRYLSYNFLAQINLGMLYGVACVAIAWIFIFDGCKRGKYLSIFVGYLFLAVCLFYKAHLFVANSFLILIYPSLFFTALRMRIRLLIGIAIAVLFVLVVKLSQSIDRVPVIRLDGSGIVGYLGQLISDYDTGVLKAYFNRVLFEEQNSKPANGMYTLAMLLLSTFGFWIAATPVVGILLRRRVTLAVLFFPLFVIANYLVMSIGLALDTRQVGGLYELVNRPLVWAYFAVVAWTAGAAYHLGFGDSPPQKTAAQAGLLVLVGFSLTSPFVFSHNLQTFPTRKGYSTYEEFNSVPLCLVKASQFIRDHSRSGEIIQDSENDPRFIVTALSERQLFVGKSGFGGRVQNYQDRLDGLTGFKGMSDAGEVRAYATRNNISWYLLEPVSAVSWPVDFLIQAIFTCDGYRVYRFPN